MAQNEFAVAFDLDGTLFSSEKILAPAYHDVLSEWNWRNGTAFSIPTTEEILRLVGRPASEIFRIMYPEMPSDTRGEIASRILALLQDRIRQGQAEIYEGVSDMLEGLRSSYPLLLVSNCRRGYLEAVLETYDLGIFFESAFCNEDAPELGKKGILVRELRSRAGVMVGDRASDGEAAREAGVPWIGCAYGYGDLEGSRNELNGADVVVGSVKEIASAVKRLKENS